MVSRHSLQTLQRWLYLPRAMAVNTSSACNRRQFSAGNSGSKEGVSDDVMKVPPLSTVFARIVSGDLPCDKLYEDEHCLAFRDLAPQAPTHVLVIPKQPLGAVCEAEEENKGLLGHLILTAASVARDEGLEQNGYRIVINNGRNGQQSVHWLHVHLLGGRPMTWPPG